MARIHLNDSGVVFNKEEHTYSLNGRMLSGITAMIQKYLFPDEYNNIPQRVIELAGSYGTEIHDKLEAFDTNWTSDGSQIIEDYISICKEYGLVHEASEYTVSDGSYWASNVDKTYRTGPNSFILADIKTYGSLTPDKLSKARWQLSILQYLFCLTNPKAKVEKLLIIHLRHKVRKDGSVDHIKNVIEVQAIPQEIVKDLLHAAETDGIFLNPYSIPAKYAEQEAHIRELLIQKEAIDAELADIKSRFLETMTLLNITRWDTETGMRITRKLPSTRSSFDLASFKREHPGLNYDDHFKTSNVSGSLTFAF